MRHGSFKSNLGTAFLIASEKMQGANCKVQIGKWSSANGKVKCKWKNQTPGIPATLNFTVLKCESLVI